MGFIVIEGLDGSGKSTQMKMLQEYLSSKGVDYEYLHFPRMDSPIFGEMIARFLRGEFGDNNSVNPYLVALLYAGDRNDASSQIRSWLQNDKLVILDRYVYSNIAYQCAKIKDVDERKKLKEWILNMEYSYFKIPKPELSIFLDAPFEFVKQSLTKQRQGDDRDYLQGNIDIHEADLDFQEKVRQVYLSLKETENDYYILDCFNKEGKMHEPSVIFSNILSLAKEHNIINIK